LGDDCSEREGEREGKNVSVVPSILCLVLVLLRWWEGFGIRSFGKEDRTAVGQREGKMILSFFCSIEAPLRLSHLYKEQQLGT
jgi:hypothetical protein